MYPNTAHTSHHLPSHAHRHRHAHPCLSLPTPPTSQPANRPSNPRLADIERSSIGIDYMAGRHFVTSSATSPFVIPGPLRFGFAATLPKMHPSTLARSTQATPVRARRLQLGLVPVQSLPSFIPESLSIARAQKSGRAFVPACCRLCLIRTSAAGLHSTAPVQVASGSPPPPTLHHLLGVCDRHGSSVAAPHIGAYRLLLLPLLLATRCSSCWTDATVLQL